MNHKPFSQEDYDKNDLKAKTLASMFLLSRGYYRLDTPIKEQFEKFKKQDFEIFHLKFNRTILVEAERKIEGWTKSGAWQGWNTLDVPFRKNESKADIYVMSNKNWDTIAVAQMPKVKMSMVKKKPCKCSNVNTEDEPFFACSLEIFKFFKSLNKARTEWEEINPNGSTIRI
jgi:hypothetical protein